MLDQNDIGKRVRTGGGTIVGTVIDVEDGPASVAASDSIPRIVRERLGWIGGDGDAYDLYPTAVATVTDQAIVLRSEYSPGDDDSSEST